VAVLLLFAGFAGVLSGALLFTNAVEWAGSRLDLGVGAVRALLGGVTGALITRQESRIVPIPFDDLMDPATGRTRVRMVDVESDSFRAALSLQQRVTRADLADRKRLEAIAGAARLSVDEARVRYAPLGSRG